MKGERKFSLKSTMNLKISILLCFLAASQIQGNETIKLQPRLIGDIVTDPRLQNNVAFFTINSPDVATCSGAFIHANWIVTAASCIKRYSFLEIRFRNGIELSTPPTGQTNYDIGGHINYPAIHPSYVDLTRTNDIALLKTFDNFFVQQYKITRVNPNVIYTDVVLRGYGPQNMNNVGQTTTRLTEASTMLFSVAQCRQYDTAAQTTKLCSLQGLICQGDQGGPLVLASNTNELIGIISVSPGAENFCGLAVKPVVTYTNIFLYRSWISKTTGITDI